ncbi:MAG: hypothetical protein ACRELV_01145 [Longimicrobiales bacterium]
MHVSEPRRDRPTLALHDRAMDNLRFIRETMERAGAFTAVPGWGAVAIGGTAILAAFVAAAQPTTVSWLAVWLGEAVLAVGLAGVTAWRKARATGVPLLAQPTRKFVLSFAPPLCAGALLTLVLWRHSTLLLLPGLWLLLYGAGVATGGAFSVRLVPLLGLMVMALGAAALLIAPLYGNLMLALGFGVLHIVFGVLIARRHGG